MFKFYFNEKFKLYLWFLMIIMDDNVIYIYISYIDANLLYYNILINYN